MSGLPRKKFELNIGFVPLLDAAPLIAAFELGYFADEGLSVVLERQIGWGNVRDKLTFGSLLASHALLGMPAASVLQQPRYPEPLVAILSLGSGGSAISVSQPLFDAGVQSGDALAAWVMRLARGHMPPLLAHVFDCSTHHYLLRDWLSKAQIDPDRYVRLCVLPPPQMVRQTANGYIDCFCVGEPWNTEAEALGCGKILATTTDVVPAHPDKVLAVTRSWLNANSEAAHRMVRAMMRAGEFCANAANREWLSETLAQPQYLALSPEIITRSFNLNQRSSSSGESFYGISASAMFPSATHAAWLLAEMMRWGHIDSNCNVRDLAARSVDGSVYRQIAAEMGIQCPRNDFPPMRLRDGWFSMDLHQRNSIEQRKGSLLPTL